MSDATEGGGAVTDVMAVPDWLLAVLVSGCNDQGARMGITLTVGGLVVTGELAPAQDFLAAFGESAAGGADGDEGAAVRSWAAEQAMAYKVPREEGAPLPKIGYIHIADARLLTPAGWAPTQGTWWRGRIDEVDGWMFGRLEQT
jgi:hypothetical protein